MQSLASYFQLSSLIFLSTLFTTARSKIPLAHPLGAWYNPLSRPVKARLSFLKGKERKMNKAELLKSVEAPVNENIPELSPGDTVSVHIKITEGDRERTQIFKGTILLVRGGGNNASFTVRRIASNGIGVERTFLLRSPRIEKVVVERHNKVRRARLYFLRERTGKSARLKQRF
jgi:large subunit ribosomal protein L19